jgi:hypothetical protein
MSVYVTDYSITPWKVVHDELGHGGTIDPVSIVYTTDPDGGQNHNFLVITCPVCQSVSTHPVGGGAQPLSVQEMFVRKIDANGCVCGQVPARNSQAALDHVHDLVTAMDGTDRWAL